MDHLISAFISLAVARVAPLIAEMAPALMGIAATIASSRWVKHIVRHTRDR